MPLNLQKEFTRYRASEEGTHLCDGFLACIIPGYSSATCRSAEPDAVEDHDRDRLDPSVE